METADAKGLFEAFERLVDGQSEPGVCASALLDQLEAHRQRVTAAAAEGCNPVLVPVLLRAVAVERGAPLPPGPCDLCGRVGNLLELSVTVANLEENNLRRVAWRVAPAAAVWAEAFVLYSLLPWRVQLYFPPGPRPAGRLRRSLADEFASPPRSLASVVAGPSGVPPHREPGPRAPP